MVLRDGRFCLSRLDTTLLFRLLVLPPGRLPQFVDKVEPSDAALVVRIKDRPRLDKRLLIRGRVIDPAGNPIVGASVEPIGRMWPGRRSFGHLPVLDPVAISDQYGNFEISTKDTSGGYFLRVTARGFASRMVQNVRVGMGRQRIKLEEGAWVAGRVLRDNEPLTGAVVGICQLDRDAGSFVGGQRLSTDSTGRFNFFNVVPDDEHVVYVETRSVTPYWIPAETLRVMGSGSRMDASVLRAQTGVALAGHVTLIDGQRLPVGHRDCAGRSGFIDIAGMEGVMEFMRNDDSVIINHRLGHASLFKPGCSFLGGPTLSGWTLPGGASGAVPAMNSCGSPKEYSVSPYRRVWIRGPPDS